MARKTVTIRNNTDGTVTVRIGRDVEHVRYAYRDKSEFWDAVKYAIISKDVNMSDVELIELLDDAFGRKQ